jgi:hypothetical protein
MAGHQHITHSRNHISRWALAVYSELQQNWSRRGFRMSSFNPLGMLRSGSLWGVYNNIRFVVQQALAEVQTASIVKVISCSNSGDLSPVGKVDVQILTNQISGQMESTPHVTMYGLPYLRIQGGSNAVIIDPQPGDIGIAVFASRDITNVKSTKAQANPASFRMHDFSDGMYLGGLLNGTPTQYIEFTDSGINIISPNAVSVTSPAVTAKGDGGTPHALVIDDWLTWYTANVQPFLVSKGYTGPAMPTTSETTVLKGQ